MDDKLLHTPGGVRDIYGENLFIKEQVENELKSCMMHYGFQEITTPAFEYIDIFDSERGTLSAKDMYKFIDRDGETLVLRPDITPQIARCVAKYNRNTNLPVRLFYHGNTYKNNSGYQGKLKEITQIGAELVNVPDPSADAEMLSLLIDCLKRMGLTEFQVEIGNAEFFRGIAEQAGFSDNEADELRKLIEEKNLFAVEELLSKKELDADLKEIFTGLPLQFGSIEFVKGLIDRTENERAVNALKRLVTVYDILKIYGKESYVSFDLGMLSQYDYYTGIVFKAYTHKTGEPIAAGGRYDTLLSKFGKPAPAIGLAVYTDYAIAAISRQGLAPVIKKDLTLVLYKEENLTKAIEKANALRREMKKAVLLKTEPGKTEKDYEEYAENIFAGNIICADY